MKTCASCNTEKEETAFYKNKRRKDGLSSRCKVCDDVSNRVTRVKNIEQSRRYRRDWLSALARRVDKWKESIGCRCCNERAACCLELHHTNPSEKENHPSSMKTSWDRFMKEAEKCVVVCSNCHKKIHAGLLTID